MTQDVATEMSSAEIQARTEELISHQNLLMGTVFGAAAAVVAAGIWAVITALTSYQIGWMAIGVGFVVGFAVKFGGKGVEPIFGVIGGSLALLGCLLGNLLTMTYFFAVAEELPFTDALAQLTPDLIVEIMTITFAPIDLLFYALAIYVGYRYAFQQA